MTAADWIGLDLGQRSVEYSARDTMLYALAIGARADQLDLVFERDLRVLPTFGLTLAQWAPDVIAEQHGYGNRAVHASQSIDVHSALPPAGELTMTARVQNVWDKGSAAVFSILVDSEYFTAEWRIFAPGEGGFGGERGPSVPAAAELPGTVDQSFRTSPNQAVLYRLTGDYHDIHVDPEAAQRIGQPRPILQGLCTLAAATLPLAEKAGCHPADLKHLEGRFSGVVFPGDQLAIRASEDGKFSVLSGGNQVITNGRITFS